MIGDSIVNLKRQKTHLFVDKNDENVFEFILRRHIFVQVLSALNFRRRFLLNDFLDPNRKIVEKLKKTKDSPKICLKKKFTWVNFTALTRRSSDRTKRKRNSFVSANQHAGTQ